MNNIEQVLVDTLEDCRSYIERLEEELKTSTCENCVYSKEHDSYDGFYECKEIADISSYMGDKKDIEDNKAYTEDYESYSSFNIVGKDFGCNRFKRKT